MRNPKNIKAVEAKATKETTANVNEQQKMLFKAIMKNLVPYGTVDGKVVLSTGSIPLTLLFVDSRYQGFRSHKKLRKLIVNWDVRKLTPIVVVPHPEEFRFAVVDGQGRLLAATELDYESLQAIVLMDAPVDIDERLKFEAEYFIGQGTEDELMKPVEKHLSRVIIGEKVAVDLDKVLERYDIAIAETQGQRSGGVLGSYPEAYGIVKANGIECMEYILSVIRHAGWHTETNGHGVSAMRAIKEAWVYHPEYREAVAAFLSKELRQLTPELFAANAKTKYPKRDTRRACCLFVEDIIVDSLHLERRLFDAA